MAGEKIVDAGRRTFITKVVPACALTCLAARNVLALAQTDDVVQEAAHKFDKELGRKLTYRQMFSQQYREFIDLAKAIEKEWGTERTMEFLKARSAERMTKQGRKQAEAAPDNNFESYVNMFRSGHYDDLLTMEIVEDTEKAFELEVTECIWADVFLRAGAGNIGFAAVCWGDYAWASSYNEKIEMVRDKTLMQGHHCCNHRYIWKG